MFMLNPPSVPANITVTSNDPAIAAVEWACQEAGLRCVVPDAPKIASIDANKRVEMINLELPELGLTIHVQNDANSIVRDRYMTRRLVFDGQQGFADLVAYLRRLRDATAGAPAGN